MDDRNGADLEDITEEEEEEDEIHTFDQEETSPGMVNLRPPHAQYAEYGANGRDARLDQGQNMERDEAYNIQNVNENGQNYDLTAPKQSTYAQERQRSSTHNANIRQSEADEDDSSIYPERGTAPETLLGTNHDMPAIPEPKNESQEKSKEILPTSSSSIFGTPKVPFKLKHCDNGNILIVHHTIKERDKLIRIRMAACCFSKSGSKFLAVDKRGNIFIFDLIIKKYWRFSGQVPKASTICHSLKRGEYLIGTKLGQLVFINIEQGVLKAVNICEHIIHNISFPGQPLQPSNLALVHVGNDAVIINLDTFKATHRLDIDEDRFILKFASYMPHSEQIFTCFTDDTLHIWSSVTLNTLRIVHPIKIRERKLKLSPKWIGEISLKRCDDMFDEEYQISCYDQNYSDGIILAYAFSPDANLLCLSTVDKYMLMLDAHTYDMHNCFKLNDFVITSCSFLSKPKENFIFVLTSGGQVILIDYRHTEFKLIVHLTQACKLYVSPDENLLAVLMDTGEAFIWSISKLYNFIKGQQYCMQLMQAAFKEKKPFPVTCSERSAVNTNLKKLLKPERLRAILVEFGRYPPKYRGVIWSSLLQLPCNSSAFQELVKLGIPNIIKERAMKLKIKEDTHRRLLVKIWSCLAHWCKVLAYSEFMPSLIFPFTQVYPRNAMVAFELCVALILNHFALWFEFHPLEPANYLGLCTNVLEHFDKQLSSFFTSKNILPKDYAWSMLSNGFSVVLDAEQWLSLWDHIISYPQYFPVFCVVAYNILQREILLRLPNADAIKQFFYEQNAVDVVKLVRKADNLMLKCPPDINPKRYVQEYMAIPKGVYPKFLNFPKKLVNKQTEDLETFRQERRAMEARIHELEVEELQMMERLQSGLKAEEHAKRIKEMEELYHNTLKEEEERMANQRQMLNLYQKEIHNRKGEVLVALHESERRRKLLEMEKEVDSLMHIVQRERQRNDSYLKTAEHEKRSQELELMAEKNLKCLHTPTLSQKYREKIESLNKERELLKHDYNELQQPGLEPAISAQERLNLDDIEKNIDEIHKEFSALTKTK